MRGADIRGVDPTPGDFGNEVFVVISCAAVCLPIGFDVQAIGRLTGTELVFLVLLPLILVMRRPSLPEWPFPQLLALALLWLGAQFFSDILNGTSLANMLRGVARSGITVVLLAGFSLLLEDKPFRIRLSFMLIAAGFVVGYILDPNDYSLDEPWKFGYGMSVSMAIIGISSYLWIKQQYILCIALCVLGSALNFVLDFRSMAGMMFMTGLLVALSSYGNAPNRRMSNARLATLAFVALISAVVLIEVYSYAAANGLLGTEAQQKLEFGSEHTDQGGALGVLLSGRLEIMVSSQAILDRPIFGHGTWATNETYADTFRDMLGVPNEGSGADDPDIIPSHSHLFGAWVEGGLLSALFWFYALGLILRALLAALRNRELADPITVYSLMYVGWSVLFSPYGLSNRVVTCFDLIIAAALLRRAIALERSEGVKGA